MAHQQAAELPHIGEALVSIRAAIDVVKSGAATRVTVHTVIGEQILPAARALAHAAGVAIETIWSADRTDCDIVISRVRTIGDD